ADGRGAEVDHPAGQGGRRMTARRWLSLRAGASDWLWVSLAVIVLDQATKFAITRSLREFDEIVLLPVLSIVRLHNEGAAFSFLSEASGWQRWFFTALAIAVSIGILICLRLLPPRCQCVLAAGLASMHGGSIYHVIDSVLAGIV